MGEMTKLPHVVVVGSLNIDYVTRASRCPAAGETLTALSLTISAGGKGGNQAVACARGSCDVKGHQRVRVSMIGAVGSSDHYAQTQLKAVLEHSGVNTDHVEEQSESQTGSANVIVEEGTGAENRILVIPGANHGGVMNDTRKTLRVLEDPGLQPYQVIILQGEIPRATVLGLMRHFNNANHSRFACSNSVHVIFNPAPMFPDGVPLEYLNNTPVLVMNETEAAQLSTLIPELSSCTAEYDEGRRKDFEEVARKLHEVAQVKIVLITLGSRGVFYSTQMGRKGYVNGVRVNNVNDTTAAGDTLVGYFAAQFASLLAKGTTPREIGDLMERMIGQANLAASVCVQRRGAMSSIPFAYEIPSPMSKTLKD